MTALSKIISETEKQNTTPVLTTIISDVERLPRENFWEDGFWELGLWDECRRMRGLIREYEKQ